MPKPEIAAIAPFFSVNHVPRMLKSVGVESSPEPHARHRTRHNPLADPDALAAEFSEPLKNTSDGLRGFELKDADGFVLFFGRPHS